MGPDGTAITIPGGSRVIDVFYGNGAPSGQISHFFRGQIGSCTPLGVGLIVGSRLHRMRQCLGPRELWKPYAKLFMVLWAALLRELAEICWKRRRMRCRRLNVYSTDPKRPRETLGPRIDRI